MRCFIFFVLVVINTYASESKSLQEHAKTAYKNQNYEESISLYKKSLIVNKEIYGIKSVEVSKNYNDLALVFNRIGKYQKAIEYYKKSLFSFNQILGNEHANIAITYNNLGSVYHRVADYVNASKYYKKSLKINKKLLGDNHPSTARNYNSLGLLYNAMGDYAKSIDYFTKAIDINKKVLGHKNESIAVVYNNLGAVYKNLKDFDNAIKYYKKSLNIDKELLGELNPSIAIVYNNLALVYNQKKELSKSEEYYKKSISIYEKLLGKEHPSTATVYNNLAAVYNSSKNYDKALEYYKKSLVIREKVFGLEHPSTEMVYNNLGIVYKNKEEYETSYNYIIKSFDISQRNRDRSFSILDNKQKQKYLESNNYKLRSLFHYSSLYKNNISNKNKIDEVNRNIFNRWLNYKGVLFDNENSLNVLSEKIKDKKVRAKIEELNLEKKKLSKLYQSIPKGKARKAHSLNIKNIEDNISELEIYLSSKVSEYKEELNLRNINYKDISSTLKDEDLYIDFAKTKSNYFIFTLDKKDIITFKEINESNSIKIDNLIQAFRKNIDSLLESRELNKEKVDSLNSDAKDVLAKLNNLIFENIDIRQKRNLILSLDGLLNFLPFEALYNKTNKKYLLENKNIKYVPSGKEYIRLLDKKSKLSFKNEIVMFTNPNFGLKLSSSTSRGSSFLHKSLFSMIFKPLPGTIEEAKLISSLYDNTTNFDQDRATSNNLFSVKSPKILHISTHGFFLKDKNITNPMLKAGLAFSGANMARVKGDSRGIVTGLKLAGLNLLDTDLVVLSACETGIGDIYEAQGVLGLNKAFIKAGAKNIVMSLWSVADKETAQLIKSFYTNLKDNKSYAKALRNSKLEMIKKDKHPFYWSSFVMNGI